MKGVAAVLAVLALLACAGAAAAAPSGRGRHPPGPGRSAPTLPTTPTAPAGTSYSETHLGLTCVWTSAAGGSVTCAKSDGTGLHVSVSRRLVVVRSADGRIVFARAQPRRSKRATSPPGTTASVAFTHSDGNVLCQWSTAGGGGALCRASDGRGYTAGVLSTVAVVISDSSNIVFIGKQQ